MKIGELSITQFTKISFVSKILMFLDPARYPVLDRKIAKAYANSFFSPLQDLTFDPKKDSIEIAKNNNPDVYDTWACWCREIAKVINKTLNETPESPCQRIRAVDVERALFTLADLKNIDKAKKACALLAGPEGWTFKRCSI